jgi:hypothetical protein
MFIMICFINEVLQKSLIPTVPSGPSPMSMTGASIIRWHRSASIMFKIEVECCHACLHSQRTLFDRCMIVSGCPVNQCTPKRTDVLLVLSRQFVIRETEVYAIIG